MKSSRATVRFNRETPRDPQPAITHAASLDFPIFFVIIIPGQVGRA